jgi:hypothetical protein
MRSLTILLLLAVCLCACKTPKLAERIPGRWLIEHYEEYDAKRDKTSGHDLDECGYLSFRKGRLERQIYGNKPHGSLTPLQNAQYAMEDSLFVIRDASGNTQERWLLTKDLTDYMEWVRVSEDKDSVFTMYLRK